MDALNPNEMPLLLAKVIADRLFDVAPADTFMLLSVTALDCIAVVRKLGMPTLRPFVVRVPTIAVPAVVADVKPVPAYLELSCESAAVVRYAGTPKLTPLLLRVPTIAVPAVVAEVNPVPA